MGTKESNRKSQIKNLKCLGRTLAKYGGYGSPYFMHPNHLGSTSALRDQTGNPIKGELYYPWGQEWQYAEGQHDVRFAAMGMRECMKTRILLFFLLVFLVALVCSAQDPAFVRIFDGKTLNGWTTPQPTIWSVEHGAITGRTTEANHTLQGGWLVWQDGEVADFQLKLKFRILGGAKANSGIQFRSTTNSEGNITRGYQADLVRDPQTIDLSAGGLGLLYDAGTGRGVIAGRGHKTVIDEAGNRETRQFADPGKLFELVNIDGWNEYLVIARGNDLKAIINRHLMSEVIDKDQKYFHASGKIALQIHHGPPMEVRFKDIFLKRYPRTKPAPPAALPPGTLGAGRESSRLLRSSR